MLTFLRRIRKSLIESLPSRQAGGSTRKYLLYAIGEIALVVIGILIALQINNWNTDKKETKELLTYLKNIENNLKDDLESLAEIKVFRDSSITHSWKYLTLAKKDKITPEDFLRLEYSQFHVFIDKYFQPRTSGFDALKTSGYIRKLNGTDLEQKLNSYYYTIDKIFERETSLNNTTETMENLAFDKNIRQRMKEISEKVRKNENLPLNINSEIKELMNHPNMTGAHIRNSVETLLPEHYRNAEDLAKSIIEEVKGTLSK